MEKYILPFNMDPPIKCYLHDLHPLGVIFTQPYEKCIQWLLNKYYKLTYGHNLMSIECKDIEADYDSIFKRYCIAFPLEICNEKMIKEFLHKVFSLNFYCAGYFNEKFTPGYASYMKGDFPHAFLIRGYDITNDELYCVGYPNGFVDEVKINVKNLYEAISGFISILGGNFYIQYYKLNEDFIYPSFDIGLFKECIYKFINSENILNEGINALNTLKNTIINNEYIDQRNIFVIYEYNKLMYLRIQVLYGNGYIKNNAYESEYKSIVENCLRLINLVIKYNILPKINIKDRIINIYENTINRMINILSSLYNEI